MNKFVTDWLDAEVENSEWIEGLPLKPFVEPDDELRKIIGSINVKIINECACQGMPEVEISGTEADVNWFREMFEGGCDDRWEMVIEYCERWIESNM